MRSSSIGTAELLCGKSSHPTIWIQAQDMSTPPDTADRQPTQKAKWEHLHHRPMSGSIGKRLFVREAVPLGTCHLSPRTT